jgi:opacity protein-like surface antigen
MMVLVKNLAFLLLIGFVHCCPIQAQNLSDNGLIKTASPAAKAENSNCVACNNSNAELFPQTDEEQAFASTSLGSVFKSDCTCPKRSAKRSVYTALNLAGSFSHLASGGTNTIGSFENTGSDNEDAFDIGGTIGVNIPIRWGAVRIECEAMGRDILNSSTGSFQPPTPEFFYDVAVENRWSALANVWFDVPWRNCRNIYFGGGLGTGGGTISIDDSVVGGEGAFTEGAWQVGFGVTRQRNRGATLDLGYRYVDFGTAEIGIENGSGGNYTLETTAHQILLGIRFNSIRDLIRR